MNQAHVTHSDAPNREPSLLPLRIEPRAHLSLGLFRGHRCGGLLLRLGGSGGGICGSRLCGRLGLGGGPESLQCVSFYRAFLSSQSTHQVITEELHNEGRVLVALLGEGVELYSSR